MIHFKSSPSVNHTPHPFARKALMISVTRW